MRRLIFAVIMALISFAILNFVYCNLDDATFGYGIIFKFRIPYLLNVETIRVPLGFSLLASFSIGMVAIAVFEALPSFFKTLELRSKNKRIRQLEKELNLVRQMTKEKDEKDLPAQPLS
ncbi:MAG: hypothetical protein A3I09_04540 [Deltaproteobacteria bacterium RIFCSPLOWO2_02_FULL_47_10]|nr:MAG: hypothetical protein A3I09_04540 [Deltaproteobacteria bacterium RIFCSPLOWO2_02_FULL_47_10]